MLRLETVYNGEEGEEEVGGVSGGATDHAEGGEVKEGEEVEGMGFVDGGEVMDLEAKAIEVVEGETEVVEVAEEVTEALEVVEEAIVVVEEETLALEEETLAMEEETLAVEEAKVVVEVTGVVEGATEVVEVGIGVVVGTEVVEAIEVVEGATEVADRDEGAEDEANSPHPHLDLYLYPPTNHTQYDLWIDIPSAHCLIYLCIPSSLLKTTQFT